MPTLGNATGEKRALSNNFAYYAEICEQIDSHIVLKYNYSKQQRWN